MFGSVSLVRKLANWKAFDIAGFTDQTTTPENGLSGRLKLEGRELKPQYFAASVQNNVIWG